MKRIALLLAAIASPVRAHVHAVNFDFGKALDGRAEYVAADAAKAVDT